jgi:hypothetical protein
MLDALFSDAALGTAGPRSELTQKLVLSLLQSAGHRRLTIYCLISVVYEE